MRVKIRKWGSSTSVRIPTTIMAAASVMIDQAVDVTEQDGRIIIEPLKTPEYALGDLVGRMTPETFSDEVDFGPAAGAEVWWHRLCSGAR